MVCILKSRKKKNYEADLYSVAMDWERLRKGSLLDYKKCHEIFSHMSPKVLDKTAIQGMAKEGFYSLEQLQKDFGLSTGKVWYEALDDAAWRRVEYIRSMRSNGEKIK